LERRKLLCLMLDSGAIVWERNLLAEMTIPDGFFGVGATPILEGDRLIVAAGGQPNAGVIAVDAATGKTLWENVGQSTWDGATTESRLRPTYEWTGDEMVVSYSSPIAATIHGRRHILALMRHGLVSLDPETGAENFHYWFRSDVHESVNAARPVVVDDTIMISAAYKTGAALLKVAPDGKSVTEVWRDRSNLLTHWSTSIYRDGFYYGFSGRHDYEATLRCLAANTGDVVWETSGWSRPTTDLRQVGQDEFLDVENNVKIPTPFYGRGSKIMIGDRFLVLSEYGLLALLKVNPEQWEEVSRFKPPKLRYPTWAAPVLSRGYLYLRSEDWLLCYDLRPAVAE
jgi:outer membrane protein assembly factor BamB